MSDGSLRNLHDIVTPSAVALWPPAPGWYVVLALLALLLSWAGWTWLRHWRANRYRRAALQELQQLRAGANSAGLGELLKRTALAAWPRTAVASLSGRDCYGFLDQSARMSGFSNGLGEQLERVSYGGRSSGPDDALFDAAERWIRNHRVEIA